MSKFLKYEDNSPVIYPRYERKSLYIPGFDGTMLALDYLRPVDIKGRVEKKPLPVVFMASRGGRFSMVRDKYPADYFNGNGPLALYLIERGYVYVAAEMRGCGASFGINDSFASKENRLDVEALIKWIMKQPWCDGNIGMMGGSNRSFIQVCTASYVAPEGLKAITPCVSNINFYYTNFPNGVSRITSKDLSGKIEEKKLTKDEFLSKVVPVDDDPNGDTAYGAYLTDQFPHNINFMGELIFANMCRDTLNEKYNSTPNLEITALPYTERFNMSGIKQHQIAGWFDLSVGGQIIAHNAWGGSILIGPWSHIGSEKGTFRPEKYPDETYHIAEEHKRWFDYALKNLNNGWDQQPSIHYYTIGAEPGNHWKWADSFPLKETVYVPLYFDEGKSGTVDSINDGTLKSDIPTLLKKQDYNVDLDIHIFPMEKGETYDPFVRQWDGDMTNGVDEKSLTFTTEVFTESDFLEMTGFPLIDIWVSSTIDDGDFIAILEEVFDDGGSYFVTDGTIRASHRTTGYHKAWAASGIPFHPSLEEDVKANLEEGMSEPVRLKFNFEPISYQFKSGSRLRVTIFCAEKKTYQHPMYDENNPPTITLYYGGNKASYIELPMIPKK